MKNLVLCFIVNTLFFLAAYSAAAEIYADYKEENGKKSISVKIKGTFRIHCKVNNTDAETGLTVKWKKEDVLVDDVAALKGRAEAIGPDGNKYTLVVKDAKEDDVGNYTCSLLKDGTEIHKATVGALIKATVKVQHSNINVVENEKLKIVCVVNGKPYADLEWFYRNDSHNATSVKTHLGDRVSFENDEKGVKNAILIIKEVKISDRGIYICEGTTASGAKLKSECIVRVKDKYAALWPFLGICAEVFVLCAIIFIYEKKRNKQELEESDTDQSPDQKNTPDHKDTNLRHRQ